MYDVRHVRYFAMELFYATVRFLVTYSILFTNTDSIKLENRYFDHLILNKIICNSY